MNYSERAERINKLRKEAARKTGEEQDQIVDQIVELLNKPQDTRPISTRVLQDYFPDSILRP